MENIADTLYSMEAVKSTDERGTWEVEYFGKTSIVERFRCSECGYMVGKSQALAFRALTAALITGRDPRTHRYCPDCGSRMKNDIMRITNAEIKGRVFEWRF